MKKEKKRDEGMKERENQRDTARAREKRESLSDDVLLGQGDFVSFSSFR